MSLATATVPVVPVDTEADTEARAALTRRLGRRTVFATRDCADAIADRRDFRAGNMSGEATDRYGARLPWGHHMPAELVARYRDDAPVYVVFSYATPIGWITADGRAVVPGWGYSPTTSQHQSEARYGLHRAIRPRDYRRAGWGGYVPSETERPWTWIDGVLVHPDTPVVLTGRRYRSRRDAERVTIETTTAHMWWHHMRALPARTWSEIRPERVAS